MGTRARILLKVALATALSAPIVEAQRPAPAPSPGDDERTTVRVRHPAPAWLGISFRRDGDGSQVVVQDVWRDSPAQRAGVQRGDTIVLWNGRRDVGEAVRDRRLEAGDTVRLRLRRGGDREREVAMVASERAGGPVAIRRDPDGDDLVILRPREIERELRIQADSLHRRLQIMLRDSLGPRLRVLEREMEPRLREFERELGPRLRELESSLPRMEGDALVIDLGRRSVAGAEFAELEEGLGSYFGTTQGVLVLKVAPETPAARAGLQAGDVVVRVDDQAVTSVAEVRRAVAAAQGQKTRAVEFEVLRKGQRRDVEMSWE